MAIWVRWIGETACQSSGGNVGRPGGGTADVRRAVAKEIRVRVEVSGRRCLRDQRAEGVVDNQVGPDLLMHQAGQPRAQHPAGAA